MIPAYSEEVKITVVEADPNASLSQQVQELQEQVRRLQESLAFIDRERNRLKSEIESIKQSFNRLDK